MTTKEDKKSKWCNICGEMTTDYTIENNAPICKNCNKDGIKKIKK